MLHSALEYLVRLNEQRVFSKIEEIISFFEKAQTNNFFCRGKMSQRWNDGKRFEGRVVIVTGANGALGSVIARRFGLEGAKVSLAVRNSREVAETVLAEIESAGGAGHLGSLDVTDRTSIKEFISDRSDFAKK